MSLTHPRTWFPLVLATLSIALLVFVMFNFNDEATQDPVEQVPAVSSEEYQENAGALIENFFEDLNGLETDADRLVLIQATEDGLLQLIVPADHREIHLEMVIALNLMTQGYAQADEIRLAEGQRRLQALYDQYSWLR